MEVGRWRRHGVMSMKGWARFMTGAVVAAGRIPFELVDRFVEYCIECECTQEQSTDLWPEYDLATREMRRVGSGLNARPLLAEDPEESVAWN
jgi:hypothetical protein